MENILIIKTGAAGDVVRTTSLLNILQGNIYWVTDDNNKLLLPGDMTNLQVLSLEQAMQSLKNIKCDRVISLEEDMGCARLANEVAKDELAGVYFDNGKINYTDNSASWFDMSRVSKFGLEKANKLKAENRETYQSHIFKMLGKEFNGEPYKIYSDNSIKPLNKLIGIERRTGKQWPDKQWARYDDLVRKLESEDVPLKVLRQQNNIRDYLNDIAECSHIVSGDSLAMHVAMAYQKSCTAIFNCTSPQEIYDYGLLKKVVSPLLNKYFYSSSFDIEAITAVSLEEVYESLPD